MADEKLNVSPEENPHKRELKQAIPIKQLYEILHFG